jgi:V/A-type H+-transporting ATPase subunit E
MEEKLQHFQESTLGAAREKSEQMLAEYRESLNQLFETHKAEKQQQMELQLKMETDSIKREYNKIISKEQLEIKKMLTKKQNELKERLFAEVQELLQKYMLTPEYQQLLIMQIKKALEFAGEKPITIYLDPIDAEKLKKLSDITGASLQVSEYGFMGGCRAVITGSHILIDNSFSTKLAEAKENFAFNGGSLNG